MARRQRLSEAQIAELFDPPAEQRELVRHFTLSLADIAAVLRCRGDGNRLGYALMLCYLRHPGRALRVGERPAARYSLSWPSRSGFFRSRSTIISSRRGTGSVTSSNASASSDFDPSAKRLPLN